MQLQDVHAAPSQNLCTQILSYDQFTVDKELAFESNLASVCVYDGYARSLKDITCTALTSVVFESATILPEIHVEVRKFLIGKRMAVGVIPEKPRNHHRCFIGDVGFASLGVELTYVNNPSPGLPPLVEMRYLDFRPNDRHGADASAKVICPMGTFASLYPQNDAISIHFYDGKLVFLFNDQPIQTIRTNMPSEYRIGTSFTSTLQEVFITSDFQVPSHSWKPSNILEGHTSSTLPHLPLTKAGQFTLISTSPQLLIFDNSTLCTCDEICTVVTAEVFMNRVLNAFTCQSCGAHPTASNRWQCMECQFDVCDSCFLRFSSDAHRSLFHPHAHEEFTCVLGGESHRVVVRIDDLGKENSEMFFGIVPRHSTLGKPSGDDHFLKYGLRISDSFCMISEGREEDISLSLTIHIGDLIHVSLEGEKLTFCINERKLGEVTVPIGQYRFCLIHHGENQSMRVVDGNFAMNIPRGSLVRVDPSRSFLEENCQLLSIVAPFEILGQVGSVVDSDDIDGTVGVNFNNMFSWVPRACCRIVSDAYETSQSIRHQMAVPYVDDEVVLHPLCVDGSRRPMGGLKGKVTLADVRLGGSASALGEFSGNFSDLTSLTEGKTKNINESYVRYEIRPEPTHAGSHFTYSSSSYIFPHRSIGSLLVVLERQFQVMRNPYFWRWGAQDGVTVDADGQALLIESSTGWVTEAPVDGWVAVFWEKTRVCEKYRWGCDNAFDVVCVRRPFDVGHRPLLSLDESVHCTFRNPESYSSFIKECHFIPLHDLKFERTANGEIGRGRFGVVYKGSWGDKVVAIKEISDLCIHQARDIGVLSRIAHPNTIRVHGWSADQRSSPTIYLIMDLVTPGSLAKLIRSFSSNPPQFGGSIGWNNFFDITIGVAAALHYLARQSLVHRDIKPDNILVSLSDGKYTVRITDFGLAKFTRREESAEFTNISGTPAYMSPEAWKAGEKITEKADIFSFGLVMLFMLTGEAPRNYCENAFQILYDLVTSGNIVQPPEGIPDGLRHLIVECQTFDPASRPDSMEVLRRLQEVRRTVCVQKAQYNSSALSSTINKLSLSPMKALPPIDPSVHSKILIPRRQLFPQRPHDANHNYPVGKPKYEGQITLPPEVSSRIHNATHSDLLNELHFTAESADILMRLPDLDDTQVPDASKFFSPENRIRRLQERLDHLLISIKLIANQTKLKYEFLFSLISKARIPLLERQSSDGVRLYFVLAKHYSRFISLSTSRGFTSSPVSPVKASVISSDRSEIMKPEKSLPAQNAPGLIPDQLPLPASNQPFTTAARQIQVSKPGVIDGRMKPFVKSPVVMNYLSFENFCTYADISSTSLLSLIEAKIITPRRIFGQTYRISCEQKRFLEDCMLPIEKFCASCALTVSEIRAFAIVVEVAVLYRPLSRAFCLLYNDINHHIMPEIERASKVSTRVEFIAFLGLSRKDTHALEELGVLEKQMSFDRLKIFEYIVHIMNFVVPFSIAQREMQNLLDLSSEEFHEMLHEYMQNSAMFGLLQIKNGVYLLKEDIQKLMQLFSQSE
ncbi:tyrosine kinase family protein [Perkinsela sp. CCAP 1560/4]|nr:tyrosine kinase family protein [Perkinsela sp. CCAP 1560/4]|eukprot:KNH09515.1 tyrosine kinase family protein [Perkinsela sp. CCAP 1560/4]